MKKNKKSESRHKVLFPIGVKLALIIGLIVLVSLGLVTYLNSYFIGQDVRRTAEDANLSTNVRIAKTVEDKLATVRSNVFQLLDLRNAAGNSSQALASQAEVFFFERNPDIAAVNIMGYGSDASRNQSILNQQFFM
ncbi:MAG: adenylate/guanylate cyclase domain-containing protein, partial [Treponema sp.]|nr:adenylate/guanylate cyclase domain-containing protein [Treponema sp.]